MNVGRVVCSPCTTIGGPGPIDVNQNVVYKFLVDSNEAGHLIGSKGNIPSVCVRACENNYRIYEIHLRSVTICVGNMTHMEERESALCEIVFLAVSLLFAKN